MFLWTMVMPVSVIEKTQAQPGVQKPAVVAQSPAPPTVSSPAR